MTAEEFLVMVQSDVRRQAEDEARLMALGKWPDGMPHSGQSCDLSGVADVLDRQPMVAENPRHRWGRILECFYVDDLSIRATAEVVGYAESSVKNEKRVALDVMTNRFFSPKSVPKSTI